MGRGERAPLASMWLIVSLTWRRRRRTARHDLGMVRHVVSFWRMLLRIMRRGCLAMSHVASSHPFDLGSRRMFLR
jgi:hypothetical protein